VSSKTVFNPTALAALTLSLLATATAAKTAPRPPPPAEAASRPVDGYPVVLRGPKALAGAPVGRFEAYSWQARGKLWQRIPVQIDEVNARGDYVLSDGMPYTRDTDDGRFDENDELVLWGGDLGDAFAPADVPEHLRLEGAAGQSWSIAVKRAGRPIGMALLLARSLRSPMPARPPAPPHVTFSKSDAKVTSSLYEYRFAAGNPALLGEVLLRQAGGTVPVIKDSQFVMPLTTPWYLPNLSFDSHDFSSEIESWQVGPLRTIVAVGVKYTAFLSLFKLHLFSELVFYRNKFEIPTVIEFVFDPSKYLKPGSGIAYALTFPEGHAWEIESNLEALPPIPPQAVAAKGLTAASTDVFYARGSSAQGAFYVQVRVDETARRDVPPPFLFRAPDFKDAAKRQAWPWLERLHGDLGVYLDFAAVKAGNYDFGLDLLLSSKAHESFTDYGYVEAGFQTIRK
jgi:hypothetical protein